MHRYGFGIDDFHHNITDGHVMRRFFPPMPHCHRTQWAIRHSSLLRHHLFFTKIPHYHLIAATKGEMRPRCGRAAAEMRPRCGRGLARAATR